MGLWADGSIAPSVDSYLKRYPREGEDLLLLKLNTAAAARNTGDPGCGLRNPLRGERP